MGTKHACIKLKFGTNVDYAMSCKSDMFEIKTNQLMDSINFFVIEN